MKIKNLLFITITLCICLMFASCKAEGDNTGGNNDQPTPTPPMAEGDFIYCENSDLTVLYSHKEDEEAAYEIAEKIGEKIIKSPIVTTDFSTSYPNEIIIGQSDRPLSKSAYLQLQRELEEIGDDTGYLIYSDGESVALAYMGEELGVAREKAISYFLDNYVSEKLVLAKGVAYSETFMLLDIMEEEDALILEDMWQALSVEYGEDLVIALRALYSCYDDNIVDWLANLYDAEIGGFYFSNSARDYYGFLPDVESTYQALGFLSNSGMTKSYNGSSSYADVISDEMKAQILSFVRGLQHENGYFYHPQWGKELTDSRLSRRGRDLNWSTGILNELGASPIYDTPNGIKGVGAEPLSHMTKRLMSCDVVAASKVILTSSSYVPDHLLNKTNFENYLNSLNLTTDSYTVGNELSSQIDQIIHRDKELVSEGYSLVDILIGWLDGNQNPKNGTWDYLEEGDENYLVYRGMDGLFKILCIYNATGSELNYVEEALATTKHCITTPIEANIVCDVYNTWYIIGMIFDNLNRYSSDRAAGQALAKRELEILRKEAPELIRASTEKILKFMQPDGAFRFSRDEGGYESQGVPVCVPGVDESGINATILSTSGLVGHIFDALDIHSNKPPIFTASDMQRFLNIIDDLYPVVKKEFTYVVEYLDFENEEIGDTPAGIDIYNNSTGKVSVVKRDDGKALSIDSVRGGGDWVEVNVGQLLINSSCFVFETDMCIKSADRTDTLGEISLLDKGDNIIYMLYYSVVDGVVKLLDASSSVEENRVVCDLGDVGRLDEWFNLRIEYYVGNHDSMRIKIYVDDELIAVSNNYFDKGGLKLEGGIGTPRSTFYSTRVSVFSYVTSEVCIDNTVSYHTNDEYEIPQNNEELRLRVDYTDSGEKIHTFDQDFGDILAEGCVIDKEDGNGKIKLTDKSVITAPLNIRATGANCTTASLDLVINKLASDGGVDMLICETLGEEKVMLGIRAAIKDENGEKILEIYELYNGNSGNLIYSKKVTLGETVKLKLEYYDDATGALIYIEDQLVAMSDRCYALARARRAAYLRIKVQGTSEVLIDNLKAEKTVKSYSDASKPQKDEIIYDFTYIPDEVLTSGEIKGGMLTINTDGFLTVPINSRGVVSNMLLLEMAIDLSDLTANKEIRINLTDGEVILVAYEIYVKNGYGYICEYTEAGGQSAVIGSFDANSTVDLKVEFYIREQTANLYADNELIGISSVVYNCQNQLKAPVAVTVNAFGDGLVIDDFKAELNYKSYKKENAKYESDHEDEVLTFESDTTGNLPKRLTSTLASTQADLKIKELFYYEKYSKVLEFTTGAGANDTVVFSTYGMADSHNMNKVSLDMCLVGTAPYDTFGFRIGKDINEYVYSFEISVAYGDVLLSITTVDLSSNTSSLARYTVAKEGQWFNLACEYYFVGDTHGFMKIFVNDAFLADLSGVLGTSRTNVTAKSFENLTLYSYRDTKATLLLDNLDITGQQKEYKAGGVDKIVTVDFEDGEVSTNGDLLSYGDYLEINHPQNLSDGTKAAFADITIDPEDATNKVLAMSSDRKSGGSGVGYPSSAINANFGVTGNNKNGYCYVFEADIYVGSESYSNTGTVATIFQNFGGSEQATGISIKLKTDTQGKKQAYLTSYYGSDKATALYTFECEEWVTLKFEFYRGKYAADNYGTIIYANGVEVARDLAWRTGLSSYDIRTYDAVRISVDRYMAGNILIDNYRAYIEDKSPEVN